MTIKSSTITIIINWLVEFFTISHSSDKQKRATVKTLEVILIKKENKLLWMDIELKKLYEHTEVETDHIYQKEKSKRDLDREISALTYAINYIKSNT